MSSEQKKFSPELMGGVSLASKIRGFLGSILDIGRSIRVKLSRIAKPDYDAISDIIAERNDILGHEFNENEQKRAEPIDPTLAKANKVVEDLDKFDEMDQDLPVVEPPPVVETPVEEVVDTPVEVIEEPVKDVPVPDPVVIEVVDEVADIMKVVDDSIGDSGKIFEDEVDSEMVTNIISIREHDNVLDQMTLDHPSYGTSEEGTPKFPESRPVQKQTTLDVVDTPSEVEAVVEEVPEEVPAVPWYTDADLIRIGIRAATEDCIETITPMMEMFDEPEIIEEPVVDELEVRLTDMAVKAMTEDAVETVIVRIAQAAKAAEALANPIVEEPAVEVQVEGPIIEEVPAEAPVVVDEPNIIEEPAPVVEEKVKIPEVAVVEAESVVEETAVVEAQAEDIAVSNDRTSISFNFGTGAARSSTGIRFRFGVLSQ